MQAMILCSRSRTVFLPLPHDDPTQRCPNIELASRQLGWQPRVPLREGLMHTIAYFERTLQRQRSGTHPAVAAAGSSGKRKPAAKVAPERAGRAGADRRARSRCHPGPPLGC